MSSKAYVLGGLLFFLFANCYSLQNKLSLFYFWTNTQHL